MMHPYSTDASERPTIHLVLAGIAIAAVWVLNRALDLCGFEFPWWVDAPSVMGFYGLGYSLFDKYLWRLPFLNRLSLITTPYLAGSWKGVLTSSFEPASQKEAVLTITQTWTRIQILLKTETSRSHSLVASIFLHGPDGPVVTYQYQNDPAVNTPESMQIHYGTARLTLDENKLEGHYYSGRGRQNIGTIDVARLG